METDFYKILGVREDAPEVEIKKAYRRIAKKYHPDANEGSLEAAERFKAASEAYAIIGDEKSRKEYDSRRAVKDTPKTGETYRPKGSNSADSRQPGGNASSINFGNMAAGFEQFFGFNPTTKEVHEEKLNPNKKTKTNPIDMTEMFEQYMGIKK